MDMGQGTVADLVTPLATHAHVAYRMVLVQPPAHPWYLHTALIDVLPPDAPALHALPFSYDYRDARALGGQMAGADARALLQHSGKMAQISDAVDTTRRHDLAIPEIAPSLQWFKFPSHVRERILPLPWPHTRFDLVLPHAASSPVTQVRRPFLIAEGCPFFPDLETLVADLIYGVARDHLRGRQLFDPSIRLRVADARSWLDQVEVSPSSVRVSVRGTDLQGVHLHLSGAPGVRAETNVQQAESATHPNGGEVRLLTLPIVGELAPSLWVLLARGTEWHDYRAVLTEWVPFQENASAVTISPPDIATQIQGYIYQGEGPRIEFKHQPPHPKDQEQKERLLKTVAAFANGEGGVIILGVDDPTGSIVGIDPELLPKGSIERLPDALHDMVRANVVPEPEIETQHGEIAGKLVLALYVKRGTQPPYGLNPAKTVFYVRRGATTFPARPDEVRALAQPPSLGALLPGP